MRRRDFVGCAAAALVMPPGAIAASAAYPQRPVSVWIGYPAGGGIDTITRLFVSRLGAQLGQSVVVEYRPGAGGMIAAQALAQTRPDGYVLGMTDSGTLTLQPHIRKKVAYATLEDFTFLGLVARMPLVLAAHASVPATTLADLVAHSKANPDQISFGSAGFGNPTYTAFEIFKRETGAQILHVPYPGASRALTDLAGGQISLTFLDVRLAQEYARDGRIRLLAIADARRHPMLADVPTFAESGVDNVAQPPWVGLTGPASMPPAVVDRLAAAFVALAKDAELASDLVRYGYSPSIADARAYRDLVKSDFIANQQLLAQLNISIDE